MAYKPLPDYIVIKDSEIEGQGIFTTRKINANELIGITHHANERAEDGWIRTPLGGFGNHSDDPNCFKLLMDPVTFGLVLQEILNLAKNLLGNTHYMR